MKKIFISSTFKDMQAERDLLHLEVLPEVNDYAAQFGQAVAISDLRWGIDTGHLSEAESSRKVLSVCFEQISECKPYMIVLLGDRYGFIPDAQAGGDGASALAGIADADGLSVTEMEILFGALAQGDLSRCAFYFRQPPDYAAMAEAAADYAPESDAHRRKLNALKAKIQAAAGARVRTYAAAWDPQAKRLVGLEGFARMVCDDIKAMMLAEWKAEAALTPEDRTWNAAWQFLRTKAAGFTARQAEETALCDDLRQHRANIHIVTGAPGSGKSCLLSAVALALQAEGWKVMPFVAGNGASSNTATDLLWQIDVYLARETNSAAPAATSPFQALRGAFGELAALYAKQEKPLLIVLDALDQMATGDEASAFSWLPDSLPANLHILATCPDDFPLPKGMPSSIPDKRTPLRPLERAEEKAALIRGLAEAAGKTLAPEIIGALLRLPGADQPLYLSMFVQRLLMLDSDDFSQIRKLGQNGDAINAYLLRLVAEAPESVAGMCAAMMEEAAQRVNEAQTGLSLGWIALSRHGLRETDIAALFEMRGLRFSSVDHARMRKYMRPYFLSRQDGRLDFSHRAIREGFLARQSEPALMESQLFEHLLRLPVLDPLRQSELAYHAMRLNRKDDLLAALAPGACTPLMLRELHDLSLADQGRWLLALVDHARSDSRFSTLVRVILQLQELYQPIAGELAILTPLLEKTIAEARRRQGEANVPAEEHGALRALWFDLGKACYAQGMPTRALECYDQSDAQAAADRKRSGDPSAEDQAKAGQLTVTVDGETYSLTEALCLAKANMLEEQGHAHNRLRRLDSALKCYEQSHELVQRLLPNAQRHPSLWQGLAVGCSELCRVHGRLHQFDQARACASEGIRHAEKAVEADPCVMSSRTLSALYGDMGDVCFSQQQWEESYDFYSKAYDLSDRLVRERNDAQSRQDLAFSARKRGDALARMGSAGRAQSLYLEAFRLVAYSPDNLMAPDSRRMLRDTATNFGLIRMIDFDANLPLYNAVANMLTLLDSFQEEPAGSASFRTHHGLLSSALSLVMHLAGLKEEADALRVKAGELLGEARTDSIPDDDEGIAAKASLAFQQGNQMLNERRYKDARKILQEAAELYNTLDAAQAAFTPDIAKRRADVIFRLGQTYLPEKNYAEVVAHYNFCNPQYERIYGQTRSDGALLDLIAIKRAVAELLDEIGQGKEAVRWMKVAVALLNVQVKPENELPLLIETAKCDMATARLSLTGKQERLACWQRAAQHWKQAYQTNQDGACLDQAALCINESLNSARGGTT